MLQWSHAQPNVETGTTLVEAARGYLASMEPRSAERGNEMWISILARNIALQWSHAQPNVETFKARKRSDKRANSFNGATLSRTWKPVGLYNFGLYSSGLQWSHAQPNVETFRRFGKQATARMLQWSHAQPNVETKLATAHEPTRLTLQWSHAQPNVETCWRWSTQHKREVLQWSHAQPNVETFDSV